LAFASFASFLLPSALGSGIVTVTFAATRIIIITTSQSVFRKDTDG
jgi:hypothetical protein